MPSDLKNYFGFVVDEFAELVHTVKSLRSRHVEILSVAVWPDPFKSKCVAVSNVQKIFTESLI